MDLERLFYPNSIAVVGASARMGGGKVPFLLILKLAGYKGKVYPVNPSHKEIDGVRVYPSLEAVPDEIDLAICCVPARHALETIEDAVKKGIRFVHFFTSGFSEIGNRDLEKALIAAARKGKTRIIGPNCLGVHCTESRVTFDPTIMQEKPGSVAFMGQSGGVTNNFTRMACARRILLNKVVSYGNQIDLAAEDFLEYFAQDEEIKVIATYIEDIKDDRAFLNALSRITLNKPVVVLKGGITAEGARAAVSHTGAMAGQQSVWSAVMRQYRCIEVQTQNQLVDVVMLATSDKIPRGPRVAYLGTGGGTSVLFADLAIMAGLSLPELSKRAQDVISEKIPNVNTSTTNPVDLGAFGFDYRVMVHAMKAVDPEEHIDVIILYIMMDLLRIFKSEKVHTGMRAMAAVARDLSKPVVPIFETAADNDPHLEQLRLMALAEFRDAGLPMYHSIEDAVGAISSIVRWSGQ